MYVAEARFVHLAAAGLARARAASRPCRSPSGSILPSSTAWRRRPTRPARARPRSSITSIRSGNGARAGRSVICLRSTYKLEGRLPVGIQLANKLREGSRRISDTLEFDSELTVLSAAEVDRARACQAHPARYAAGRRARAEHLLRQPGDAVRQAPGGVPGASERSRQDRGQRVHGAGDRVEHARQAEAVSPTCRCCATWCRRRCLRAEARSTAASRSAPGCRSMPATRSGRSRRSWRPAARPPASRTVNPVR